MSESYWLISKYLSEHRCLPIDPPINGAVLYVLSTFAQLFCPTGKGYYPNTEKYSNYLMCRNKVWIPFPNQNAEKSFDCVSKYNQKSGFWILHGSL